MLCESRRLELARRSAPQSFPGLTVSPSKSSILILGGHHANPRFSTSFSLFSAKSYTMLLHSEPIPRTKTTCVRTVISVDVHEPRANVTSCAVFSLPLPKVIESFNPNLVQDVNVYPRECCACLLALETAKQCSETTIANEFTSSADEGDEEWKKGQEKEEVNAWMANEKSYFKW